MTEAFWEDFYRDREQVWTGKPNELLVREVSALPPGTALDLGCGEGGDAIWLASLGWRVTAVDVSSIALKRAAARAEEAGVGAQIDWQQHDLSVSFPAGTFDLVSAQFFHSPVEVDGQRDAVLRRAAQAVAPGGVLVIAGHAGWASNQHDHPHDVHFPTTAEVLAVLDLGWQVETDDLVTREVPELGTRADNVLRLRRPT